MKEIKIHPNETIRLIALGEPYSFKGYKEMIKWNGEFQYIPRNVIFDNETNFTPKDIYFMPCLMLSDSSREGGIRYIELKYHIRNSLEWWEKNNNDTLYLKRIVITRIGKNYEDTRYKSVVYSSHNTELDYDYLLDGYKKTLEILRDKYPIDMDWQKMYDAYKEYNQL